MVAIVHLRTACVLTWSDGEGSGTASSHVCFTSSVPLSLWAVSEVPTWHTDRRNDGYWALQIQRLEGSRCGGGRLCNLNAPKNAGDRDIVSVWLLIGAVRPC